MSAAQDHLAAAERANASKNWKRAQEAAIAGIEADPQGPRALLLIELAYAEGAQRKLDAAAVHLDEAERLLAESEDTSARIRLLDLRGRVRRDSGDLERAYEDCLQAQDLADRFEIQDPGLRAKLANALASLAFTLAKFQQAAAAYERQLTIATSAELPTVRATALSGLAIVYYATSELEVSERYAHKSLLLFEELGIASGIRQMTHRLAVINADQGNLDEAERWADRLLASCTKEDHVSRADAKNVYARVALARGALEMALAHAREATDETVGDPRCELHAQIRGWVHERRGEHELADRWFLRALELAAHSPASRQRILDEYAAVHHERGDSERAYLYLRETRP